MIQEETLGMAPKKNKSSHLNYSACQILPISVLQEDTTTSGGKNNRKARGGTAFGRFDFQALENNVL